MDITVKDSYQQRTPDVGELFIQSDCFTHGGFPVLMCVDREPYRDDAFMTVNLSDRASGETLSFHKEREDFIILEQENELELTPKKK